MAHRLSTLLLLLVTVSAHGQQQETLKSAESWYTTEYAPLYAEEPWEHVEELARHFTSTVQVHDAALENIDSLEWMSAALEEWRISGWTHSEIVGITTRYLNPSTVYFITRWRDHYADGSVAFECGWYLVDRVGESWKISGYASMTCTESATADDHAIGQRAE